MKKILLAIVLFVSCEQKNNIVSKQFVEMLSNENTNLPSRYSGLLLFAKVDNETLTITNINELKRIFKEEKGTDIKKYLNNLLNQNELFSHKYIDSSLVFKFDKKVENGNIQDFLEKSSFKNSFWLKKMNISKNQLFSILYVLFKNNYKITFDDYIGKYKLSV